MLKFGTAAAVCLLFGCCAFVIGSYLIARRCRPGLHCCLGFAAAAAASNCRLMLRLVLVLLLCPPGFGGNLACNGYGFRR